MADTKKINYIAVFYIGDNRDYESYQKLFKYNPLFFIEQHIMFLSQCEGTIDLASIVVNDDIDANLKDSIVEMTKVLTIPCEVIFRKNGGYSYGGWNDVIKKNLYDYEYFFMIEDDYIPGSIDFYKPFLERITDDTPYVCCVANHGNVGKLHAANSNGMVSAKACRDVFNRTGNVFRVNNNTITIHEAWNLQTNFLDSFTEVGYNIRDILDSYCIVHPLNCHNNQLAVFGDTQNPTPIKPILLVI